MKNNTRKNRRKDRMIAFLSTALVGAVAVCGMSLTGLVRTQSALAEANATVTYTEPAEDTSPALYVAQKNAKSVVGIITNQQTWDRATGEVSDTPIAQGSGVVIREGGYVLTNNHVIEDGETYQVLFPNGDKIDTEIVGKDSSTDLAVLKVTERADELVPVTVGSSDMLNVGATAIAIGNPGGEVLANTVTQGIISALERTSVNSSNTTREISYIQHDAAINSGNSGGGLFNYKGELIGINTLKYSGSAYSGASYEGLGFAIPIDTAIKIADDLITNGKVLRPGLGVTVTNYSGPDEPTRNYPPQSVCINTVNEGGAAEKAGLKQYDFIYEVEGNRITSLMDLTRILDAHEAGDTVSVTVVRYNSVGFAQNNYNNSMFNYPFGFGFGYGFGNDYYGNDNDNSGNLTVGNGYEMVTVDVQLEIIG